MLEGQCEDLRVVLQQHAYQRTLALSTMATNLADAGGPGDDEGLEECGVGIEGVEVIATVDEDVVLQL